MQRTIKALAFTLLALSAQHLSAYTNRTFLSTRPQGVDSLLERVTLQSMSSSKAEDSFGGIFQGTLFYNEAIQTSGIGRYFLYNDKGSAVMPRTQLQLMIPDQNTAAPAGGTLKSIADNGEPASPLSSPDDTTTQLIPTLRSYGICMTYYQDLEKILPGLYFDVRIPIVEVEADLGLIATGGNSAVLKNFLAGSLNEIPPTAPYARQPLKNGLINGKQQALGIADIDLRMGYAFFQETYGTLGFNMGLTVPTGNQPEGQYAFEAIYGNNGHWGVGAGIEGRCNLWERDESKLEIHAHIDYRNLFTNTERRFFGIQGLNWGQYQITAPTGSTSTNTEAIPAANITALNMDVTPGTQLDNVLGFTYTYGGLTMDLGYNLWYRDRESLKLRDPWSDAQNVYLTDAGIATQFGIDPTVIAGHANAGAPVNFTLPAPLNAVYAPLTAANGIDFESARTPTQTTHKVLAGAGYIFREFEYPIMLGFGGHYEVPSDNASIRTWGFYLKTGIAF